MYYIITPGFNAQVLVHWACTKVSAAADVPDAALRDAIAARLAGCPGARYATVAAHAQAVGRKGLAALLLEHETCAAEQVLWCPPVILIWFLTPPRWRSGALSRKCYLVLPIELDHQYSG